MKKFFKAVLALSMMVLPFVLVSCEKDYGTSGYGNHSDSDWKKYEAPAPVVDYDEDVQSAINFNND